MSIDSDGSGVKILTQFDRPIPWQELRSLLRHRRQFRPGIFLVGIQRNSSHQEIYLHGALIDQHAVELDKGIIRASRLVENNGGDATADSVGTVSEHGPSHMANGLVEVFL